MSRGKVLIYLIRRDLRVADNPVLHHLTTTSDHGYTHLLPLYVFDPLQIEISGFLKNGESSPYPEARSAVGGFWRTGPHRAKFIAQSVWDLKQSLEQLNSGLSLRFGTPVDIIKQVIESMKDKGQTVGGVYMTDEKSSEEKDEQISIKALCEEQAVDFKLWQDEKYFIDDRDTGLENAKDLPDIFTSYRKMQEPLRERPRTPLTRPEKSKMLPLPEYASDTSDDGPFVIPRTQEDCEARMLEPLKDLMANPPAHPEGVGSAHPFDGGETHGWERIEHLIKSGGMTKYKETRNGLLGPEFSTKLSAYLALGCITARQVHHELIKFEDGRDEKYKSGAGYGQGENDGTRGVRFELLWRDYMRLCTVKFGRRLFHLHGFRQKEKYDRHWKSADKSSAPKGQQPSPVEVQDLLQRVFSGTTGLGLIDASQRELFHTGYTSNRARQNVASFLAKHLEIDWRYGAEWYEMLLVDYDVSSNWANWQYVAGVGNDPRGDERQFNPVKQAFDYDKEGSYVRSWVPELKDLERLECVFQVSTAKGWELSNCGLENNIMATNPVKRIQFVPNRKPRPSGKQQWRGGYRGFNRRGGGNGGRGGGGGRGANGGAADGGQSGHQGNDGHDSNQTNGHSGAGHNGQNGNNGHNSHNNHGGTQHRGGHGGPTRGGESTRDAFWSGETKSGMADSTSSDDATVQSDYHSQHHHTQPTMSQQGWHGPGSNYPGNQRPDRGSHRGGYGSDRGGYNGWRQDYPKYWTQPGWTQQTQGIPFPNTYFNGTAPSPYDRSFYPSEAPPPIHFQSHPQPWFMSAQNEVQHPGYPAFSDTLPGRGNYMTAGPPGPITYQEVGQHGFQPQPMVQPTPDHVHQKQMSVEARPFVPGQSPEMTNTTTGVVTMMVPVQMGVMQPDPVVVLPPVWGSDGSDSGSQDTRHLASQGAPPVIAHGGGAWGLHATPASGEAWARA